MVGSHYATSAAGSGFSTSLVTAIQSTMTQPSCSPDRCVGWLWKLGGWKMGWEDQREGPEACPNMETVSLLASAGLQQPHAWNDEEEVIRTSVRYLQGKEKNLVRAVFQKFVTSCLLRS